MILAVRTGFSGYLAYLPRIYVVRTSYLYIYSYVGSTTHYAREFFRNLKLNHEYHVEVSQRAIPELSIYMLCFRVSGYPPSCFVNSKPKSFPIGILSLAEDYPYYLSQYGSMTDLKISYSA